MKAFFDDKSTAALIQIPIHSSLYKPNIFIAVDKFFYMEQIFKSPYQVFAYSELVITED